MLAETPIIATQHEAQDVNVERSQSVSSLNRSEEEKPMPSTLETPSQSKAALWTGRIISGLVVLFMVFDGVTKLMKVEPVLKAAAQLGFSVGQIVTIGIVLLACTIIYAIPRTSILGAILLTGYLGGATSIQFHAGNPAFETLFPVIFGVLVWAGVYLRDPHLRALIPIRRRSR